MFNADRSLGASRWHLIRLGSNSRTEVVLLSPRFFEITVHFHGCSILCPGDDCPLCQFLSSRGLFYVAAHCMSRIMLLELGSQSAATLEQHCKLLHGGMKPGHVIELSRRGAKHPVHSEVLRFQENCNAIDQLTLAQRVMAVYKFPPPNPCDTLESYEQRLRSAAMMRASRLAESLLKRPAKN